MPGEPVAKIVIRKGRRAVTKLNPIRVLLVDDDPNFLDALGVLFAGDERFDVVGTARDGNEALLRAIWLRPHVVTMDIEMPTLDGVEATRKICRNLPGTRVVVVSGSAHRERAETVRVAGASAFLTKSRVTDELLATVEAVARGQSWVAVV
jgi:DNA-binding NarL/FixJ family response regulator